MKQGMLMVAAVGLTAVMSGCVSGYVPSNSFGTVTPGVIYSETRHGSYIGPKLNGQEGVQILGDAQGESTAANTLLVVAFGDCGIEAAKADALKKYPAADDLVNIEVDTKHRSILSIFNTVTTVIRGKAVKYK